MKRFFCILYALLLFVSLLAGCAGVVGTVAEPSPAAPLQAIDPSSPPVSFTPSPPPSLTPAPDVIWEDAAVEAEARKVLMKREGAPVMQAELLTVTELTIGEYRPSTLADLRYFENLETLFLSVSPAEGELLDLTPIGEAKSLCALELSLSDEGYDLSFLKELPHLTSLTLVWPSAGADISALSALTNLAELGLIEMTALDLKPLSGMTQLTALALKYCDVKTIKPLKDLVNLQSLMLQDSPQLIDLSPVANMKALKFLDLTGCFGIKSLKPLKELQELTELFIAEDLLIDRTPVKHVRFINGQENAPDTP